MFEKILVCLDGSELAEQILPYAVEEARRFQSQVVLLQVVHEHVIITPPYPGTNPQQVETRGMLERMEQRIEQANNYLEVVANQVRLAGLGVESVVLEGPPGETIDSYANENDIGLIAIATHGRGGLGRAIFGSVADYVLRKSWLPILVVRTTRPAAAPEEPEEKPEDKEEKSSAE